MERSNLICGVDFETSGFETDKHFVIEIGAALFDADTWETKDTFSTFVFEPKALPLDAIIKKVTGITDEDVRSGLTNVTAFSALHRFLLKSKAVFAHNAPFDQGFFNMEMARVDFETKQFFPWYCTMNDIPHEGKTCRKLSHLCVDYGLEVNGSKLHRALDDVLLMGRLLKVSGMTFEQIKEYSEQPWMYLQADVAKPWEDNGESTAKAKADGYSFEKCIGTPGPIFPKKWVKRIKVNRLEEEKKKDVGFKRSQITPRD